MEELQVWTADCKSTVQRVGAPTPALIEGDLHFLFPQTTAILTVE